MSKDKPSNEEITFVLGEYSKPDVTIQDISVKLNRSRYFVKKILIDNNIELKIKQKKLTNYDIDLRNGYKKCKKCKYKLPLTDFCFGHKKNQRTCLRTACNKCYNQNYKTIRDNNKDYYNKLNRTNYYKNHERQLERAKQMRETPARKNYMRKYYNTRRKKDINFRLRHVLSCRVHHAIQNNRKSKNTMQLIGCPIEELKAYLESKFIDGMTWENYGQYGWHIDHIIPCIAFDLSKPEEQAKCFHYTNLQPLWAKDNLAKLDKLPNGDSARKLKR